MMGNEGRKEGCIPSRRSISLLDPGTVTRIAAGEVIERPASVVKELVENSIDADASSVTVEIKTEGGRLTQIRVVDDGCGIPPEEVALAFLPHATSKIQTLDDLSHAVSLGFRGEALASIAAVARVTLTSAERGGSGGGSLIRVESGTIVRQGSAGRPPGTTVVVEDLFFNTPARRKFQRSAGAEMALITGTMEAFALAEPAIAFRLVHNGRTRLSTEGTGGLPAALAALYGPELARAMIPVSMHRSGMEVEGSISPPGVSRSDPFHIYISVNRRVVASRTAVNALRDAYGTLLPRDRHPVAVLSIKADPSTIDVNIHPAKRIIRFEHEEEMRSLVEDAVSEALDRADLAPRVVTGIRAPAWEEVTVDPSATGYSRDGTMATSVRETSPTLLRDTEERLRQTCLPVASGPLPGPFGGISVIGQFADTYLLARTGDGDLALIDQHAAHERVLYEEVTGQAGDTLPSQELLEPVPVPLTPHEEVGVARMGTSLAREGFVVESFGQGYCLVRAVPVCLGRSADPAAVREVIAEVLGGRDGENLQGSGLRERVARIAACRGAIKSGAPCTPEQGDQLIARLAATKNPWTCPHGRPTMVILPRSRIDRMFYRT